MRPTGPDFEAELIRGLTEAGVDVIKIGMATTPMFYYAVHVLKAEGGIHITASHNPGEYNGMKMTRAEAVPIAIDSGLSEIRDLVEQRDWPEPVAVPGTVTEESVKDAYIDLVTEGQSAEGLKIVIDAGNGMAGLILQEVFERIGGEVVPLYWELDGAFPNHEANPLVEENMRDIQAAIKEHGADLGAAFDGDGDRVFFVTERAETVDGDVTTALIATEILKENPGATVIYDLRSTRATREVIEESGGHAVITRVGHSFIKAKMREENALFAGEVSGHFYFTPWYAESGMLAMMNVCRLIKETGQPLSALIEPINGRYATSPELNFEVEDKEGVMEKIKQSFPDANEILELDGITIRFDDWWTNVRPSGTEPLLRLKVEATSPELLKDKRAELEKLIGGTPVTS